MEGPLLLFSKPDDNAIRRFLAAQQGQVFSYAELASSRTGVPPSGYNVDHNRIRLGEGPAAFERAVEGIRRWEMFRMPWIQLCWHSASIEPGTTVAVLVSVPGAWSLNACRIVYGIDEARPQARFGFAYGTLPDHAEIGEERFTVEMNDADGSVWYDVLAFSRPGHLARLAYPYTRALQKRFARDSLAAMKAFVRGAAAGGG